MPNTALAEGEIDMNSYQHEPFLIEYNEDHNTDLTAVFPTLLSAIGVYSNDVEDIEIRQKVQRLEFQMNRQIVPERFYYFKEPEQLNRMKINKRIQRH